MDTDLKQDLARLTKEVIGLRNELRADYVPRDEQNQRRRQAAIIVVVAMLLSLTVENTAITRCFLSRPGGLEYRVCSLAFPGYGEARKVGDVRLGQFNELLEGIPANAEKIKQLQDRIDRLEHRRR